MTHYLVFDTLQEANDRSVTQCNALGCDGVYTIYWWGVIPGPDGKGALEIYDSGDYGVWCTNLVGSAGLSPEEQAAMVDWQTLYDLGWFPDD